MDAKTSTSFLTALVLTCALIPVAKATTRLHATEILKQHGPATVGNAIAWTRSAQPQKNTKRFQNKFFSFDYPECYEARAAGGEKNPQLSATILARRTTKCSSLDTEVDAVEISKTGYDQVKSLNHRELAMALYKQPVKLGDADGIVFASVIDDHDKDRLLSVQLQWRMYTLCDGYPFEVIFGNKVGEESLKRIEKKDFSLPKEFEQIASTFRCAEPIKEKAK